MAISFVGASSGTYATPTVSYPSGWQAGDLLLLVHSTYNGVSTPNPSGWTMLRQGVGSGGPYAGRTTVWYRVAQAGDTASVTVNSSDIDALTIAGYRGVSPTAPIDVHAISTSGASSTTATAPSVSAGAAGSLLVGLFAGYNDSGTRTITPDSPLTMRSQTNQQWAYTSIGDQALASAGATGTRTATISVSANWGAVSVVLAPGVTDPSGAIAATLPDLSANLSGGIEFSGTVAAVLPALGANLAGESYPPGIAGDLNATLPTLGGSLVGAYSDTATLAAILPQLSANLAGSVLPPPVTGTLDALLPGLAANLAGQAFEPGTSGFLAAVLPALSASFSGDVLGRTGLGLSLDSDAVLTVADVLEPEPTVPAGTPPTVLHVIAPTVPVPTLVAGRPQ